MSIPRLVGAAWGVLLAAPVVGRARRRRLVGRAGALAADGDGSGSGFRTLSRHGRRRLRLGPLGRVARSLRDRSRSRRDDAVIAAELPVALDLLGVAVGAGCTPYLAVEVAARWAPPVVGARMAAVRRACGLGASLAGALDDVAAATPRLRPLADALLASDRLGAPVGAALERLAQEQRAALRRRAEADARTVPVRLLFPLVFLVLPSFGLLTVVPTLVGGFGGA